MTQKPASRFQATIRHITVVSKAQGAMGWMMRGDLHRTHLALTALTPAELTELSVAAAAVSSIADEMATWERGER